MFGLMGLQISDAAALVAAGAPDHLVEQLPGSFRGARIAVAEPQIGIDHADEIQAREMVALRHQLRADNDVDTALGDLVQLAAHGLDRGDQVTRQHHRARLRKQRNRLFLEPLHTRADRDQRLLRRAIWAGGRTRHREAAMMADQALAEAMIDQPSVADGAGEAMAAGAT
jgi:hypothetical protein